MTQKFVKTKKSKIVPKKVAVGNEDVVIVGSYKTGQLAWIKKNGVYNYPVCEGDDFNDEALRAVKELWLFADVKSTRHAFAVKGYVGKMAKAEFVAKYPTYAKLPSAKPTAKAFSSKDKISVLPKSENRAYYVFEVTPLDYEPTVNTEIVIARTADFGRRTAKIKKAIAQFKVDGEYGPLAAYLPKPLSKVPSKRLRVSEEAVQMEFLRHFDCDASAMKIVEAAKKVENAKADGKLTCIEICAGAGGQAIGLERAGFAHVALVEYESEYCDVLRRNNPAWNVICADVHYFDGHPYRGVDLLAGGVPCPPFSVASRQLGKDDERDLFPEALRLLGEIKPKAVMIENVRGLLDPKFDEYREAILSKIDSLGYDAQIKLLHASDYGVPQIRPRVVIVGIRKDLKRTFAYPTPNGRPAPTVGEALRDMMSARGWRGANTWAKRANAIAPTIVGGSKKHGGPDLGPTRARKAWAVLGVDGLGIANEPPQTDFVGVPKLTKEMIAVIQGFPREWNFGTKKTAACRMIGNAFPPPVAEAVGVQIRRCLNNER